MTSLSRSAFDRLAEPVRRWIWQQKWPSLRDVQERAIPIILSGGDVVISARTAAGKTEAAFLPLLSRISTSARSADGFALLYVSPLKALINDQHRRLESLCELCDIPLHKWHGDVNEDAKTRARKRPSGIVLITPESLEALLVRRGREASRLFSRLDAVVIDELHAFIGTERGMQLLSILTRIEASTGRDHIDRIGLSATLGDMHLAAEALRPGAGAAVAIVEGTDAGSGVKLQIRGYAIPRHATGIENGERSDDGAIGAFEAFEVPDVPQVLADDLFRFLRGSSNLLFAGSRANVEIYSDCLRRMCEERALPNEFFPHHGNLSKATREDVEQRLREDPRPTTAIATTTLELGIDIGDVETVAQIGPGFSVASLRQRLGRSGRRPGKPAILRIFVTEPAELRGQHPVDGLRFDLVQSIAMVECLRAGWCEAPAPAGLHLSTLIHQVLALILQTGGVRAPAAWNLLCERGPFRSVDRALFVDLLRSLAANQLIEQSPDGLLMIGEVGETLTESYEFYPVFMTEQEYRLLHEGRTLGTYPLSMPVARDETLIFGGRRWQVIDVDDHARVIVVRPTRAGKPPYFSGSGFGIDDHLVAQMRALFLVSETQSYLDARAAQFLQEARDVFRNMELHRRSVVAFGSGALVFPWVGTKKLRTLTLALLARELKATQMRHCIEVRDCAVEGVLHHLEAVAAAPVDGASLARRLAQPQLAKFDGFLSAELMNRVTEVERLDLPALQGTALSLLDRS